VVTYVCKKLDQYSIQVPSETTHDIYTVKFDPATLRIICTCKGYHNWGHCKHLLETLRSTPPECSWIGTNPGHDSQGNPICPKCGARVYERGGVITQSQVSSPSPTSVNAAAGSGFGVSVQDVRSIAQHVPDNTDDDELDEEEVYPFDKKFVQIGDMAVVRDGDTIVLFDEASQDEIIDVLSGDYEPSSSVIKFTLEEVQTLFALLAEVL
jgi:hypothetical protein